MKKVLTFLVIMIFLVTTVSLFTPSVLADAQGNGPSESEEDYVYIYNDPVGEEEPLIHKLIYSGDPLSNVKTMDGITYSKETNTLTLNNANYPTCKIEINQMGKDFTIQVIGTNSFLSIGVWADGYCGSLIITGTGTLKINEGKDRFLSDPIFISADYSESVFNVASTVNLSISVADETKTSVYFEDTLVGENGFVLPNANKNKLTTVIYNPSLTRLAKRLDFVRLWYCTPKDGTDYSQTDAYAVDLENRNKVYRLVNDETLERYIAVPLVDSDQSAADIDDFDVNEDVYSDILVNVDNYNNVWDIYRYIGEENMYKGQEFSMVIGLNDEDELVYFTYKFANSNTYGSVLIPVEDLSGFKNTDSFLERTTEEEPIYTYSYYGSYPSSSAPDTFTGLKKEADGKYYYYKNGTKMKATLLVKHSDNKWYYVKNGVVTKATLLFKHTDGKYYYIKNGVKTNATLLFKHTDGKWYYVKNGVVTKATLLFKHTDGKFYYIKNGIKTNSTLLFKHTDGKYYYIKNGVKTNATLLFKHTDGKYYYVKNGVVTKSTLIYLFNGKKRYVKSGVWQSGFSGKVKISGKTYTIKKGNVV
ncbi:MAG: hypothetical protein J6Z00_00540 [Clostridia bacterium]|nr:hypothetical protein [Clostridia bacterium]